MVWINEIKHGECLAQSLARGEGGRTQPRELRKAKQAENLAFCKHKRHLTSLAQDANCKGSLFEGNDADPGGPG